MNILKVVHANDGGGVLISEQQQTKELVKKGHNVFGVIVGQGKSIDIYKNLFSHSIFLEELSISLDGGVIGKLNKSIKTLSYAKKNYKVVVNYINKNKITIDSIIFGRVTFVYLCSFIGRSLGSKIFWQMHGSVNHFLTKNYLNFILRFLRVIPIANSKYTRFSIGSICKNYVYPGFDESKMIDGYCKYRSILGIEKEALIFGFAARISYDKAQDIVIKAFVESNAINSGAHLIIAGSHEDLKFLNYLQSLAGELYGKNIHFIGWINDLNNFYSSIDVAISACRGAEAFGISIVESLSVGVPVIVYYLGGPSEIIENTVNGWLIEDLTVKDYKEAINLVISDRNNLKNMKSNCIDSAQQYKASSNVDKLISILQCK